MEGLIEKIQWTRKSSSKQAIVIADKNTFCINFTSFLYKGSKGHNNQIPFNAQVSLF